MGEIIMKGNIIKMLMVFVGLAFMAASLAVRAVESGPSLAHLTKFVGKYPSGYADDPSGKPVKKDGILDDRAFRQVLSQILGKDRFSIVINKYDVETPVEQKGQILYFMKAKPHNAGNQHAIIYINLSDNSVEACWVNEDDKNYWLSSKRKPVLIERNLASKGMDDIALFEKYGNK